MQKHNENSVSKLSKLIERKEILRITMNKDDKNEDL